MLKKLSTAAETLFEQFREVRKGQTVFVPQHLWPILDRCDIYIRDNAQELIDELEKAGYIEEAPKGFRLTDDGYNYLWRRYTQKLVCPHCGNEI